MSAASMKAGRYTGCEVLSGLTVPEIWELVNIQEKTGAPYMMLENVCYRRDVMAVLNMVEAGIVWADHLCGMRLPARPA